MQSAVIILRNPFAPTARDVLQAKPHQTISQWLAANQSIQFNKPTICLKDGQPVLRECWASTQIDGVVVFVTLPQGGGGGGGGKNPLRTVLMIAVMVVATVYAGPVGSSLGFSGSMATAVGSAAIMTAGSVLVSALVPLPSPSLPAIGSGAALAQPSPTYSLQGQGNFARLSQPIPVIYGRHIVYPDLAATPYGEYVSNDQFLHQLHCIGLGEYDIEKICIEDSPITAFDEVEYQIVAPGQHVTLFDPDVVTASEVAGQELVHGEFVGGFAITPSETQITHIGLDVILPRGLYYANDSGGLDAKTASWRFDARKIDDEGVPFGEWFTLGAGSLTLADSTAQRLSFKYPVALGRYEVRATRLESKDQSSRVGHEVRWAEARGYVEESEFPPDVTLLAIKMRATDNLSQRSSRQINCVVTRKLPTWSPQFGWGEPIATRAIAWAFADVLRAHYGAKLSNERIDLVALAQLDSIWSSREDYFDAIFDQSVTVWEALTRIARCGRSVPFLQGGIVRIVRDEPRSLPVALFSARNIVKNSLKIQYIMPGDETADSVTVEFFSSRTWKPDEVTVGLVRSQSLNPAKVRLFGCTNEAHAIREGLYIAAANRYRRRIVTFRTELEGLIPTYGDLVAISHDMPSWGTGGEIMSWDPGSRTAVLSEDVSFEAQAEHVMALRMRDGSVAGPYAVITAGTPNSVVFEDPPGVDIRIATDSERTHFAFGRVDHWATLARVITIRPRGDQVEVTCVAENSLVHSADI